MRRIALIVLVVSVAASAVVGIVSLIAGDFGQTESKVLLTSLCVTGASILAMACGAALDRARNPAVPVVGILLAVAGFGLVIVLVWLEGMQENGWKTAATLLVFATSAAHASLLSLARLPPVHAWLRICAIAASVQLASLVSFALWGEFEEDWILRTMGVLAILLCAFTILVPVVQRFGRTKALPGSGREAWIRYCPSCRTKLDLPPGAATCRGCGARFRVDYEDASADSSSSSQASSSGSASAQGSSSA